MITCQHARQLFDRYLDGELSSSLQAELHAHQLSCSACQSELAMLEACGDVVALDRCEPRLSASFTDRVLSARQAQLSRRPRRWGRRVLVVGSPMAAAASILLAVMLIMPSTQQQASTEGVVAGVVDFAGVVAGGDDGVIAAPKVVRDVLGGSEDRTNQEKRELDQTPEMPAAGFMEELLAQGVERTQESVGSLRSAMLELELLLRQGFSEATEKLVDRRRPDADNKTVNDTPAERPILDLGPLGPLYLHPEPSSEATADPLLLDPL